MQNSFSITCITQWRNSKVHCVSELYLLFQFSYLYAFYKPNNIATKHSLKIRSYFQS